MKRLLVLGSLIGTGALSVAVAGQQPARQRATLPDLQKDVDRPMTSLDLAAKFPDYKSGRVKAAIDAIYAELDAK